MALTKTTSIDQITVAANYEVLVREAVVILENDQELSKTYHRTVFYPGQDLNGADEKIVAVCNAVWTPEVIDSYNSAIELQKETKGA